MDSCIRDLISSHESRKSKLEGAEDDEMGGVDDGGGGCGGIEEEVFSGVSVFSVNVRKLVSSNGIR